MKFKGFSKFILSRIAIAIVILFSYFQTSNLHAWKWGHGIIYWDTISYYAYLPAFFIHHDLSLGFIKENPEVNNQRYWPETTKDGKYVIKTSCGLAYLYFPFFITAHLLATPLGFEADGFSEIYQMSLAFSPLLYLLIGLIFLRKILKKYFSDAITAISLLSIGGATNLFHYTSVTTISHTYSFAAITVFLFVCLKWLEKPTWLTSVFMGLLLGLISLIRPTNTIMVLFPLLFGIHSFRDLGNRIIFWLKKPQFLLIIIAGIILVWLPQFIYWKHQTGQLLYFSYKQEERFFWLEPAIFRGLFGFRKGWLIYSPIMIFSLIGIGLSLKKMKDWFLPLIIIIPVSIYIMLCWWTWWYGGGFGMRPIIDYYGLLGIPFALAIQSLGRLRPLLRYTVWLFFLFFFYLGIFHHLQAVSGAIHWDSMTWKSYMYNFGHTRMTPEAEKYLVHPDYEEATKKREWD
ncbi:MAG: hypothetical protein H6538_02835 [Bacteroidales bacterium]|nr:hypothetical protein [Bacteroidales bacterium]MCB8999711.1 hypothetical protein [Bacteroidales bacterium]MCB9013129.1 hypothetical protein [Bacteroidales bacterium]